MGGGGGLEGGGGGGLLVVDLGLEERFNDIDCFCGGPFLNAFDWLGEAVVGMIHRGSLLPGAHIIVDGLFCSGKLREHAGSSEFGPHGGCVVGAKVVIGSPNSVLPLRKGRLVTAEPHLVSQSPLHISMLQDI